MSSSVPLRNLFERHPKILAEAAVVERLRRNPTVEFHPELLHAPLVYTPLDENPLVAIYREYVAVAREAGLPLLLTTPTWRTNRERVERAHASEALNEDAVGLLRHLTVGTEHVYVGGLLGCKNDCYRPEQALTERVAEDFHTWQVERLASAAPDFLIAETMPELHEARGMARALGKAGLPYFVSFVVGRDGHLLDGTPLRQAIDAIDTDAQDPPMGYLVNCAYPTFLPTDWPSSGRSERLVGWLANASSLDHCELEGRSDVHAEPLADFTRDMARLHRDCGIRLLGGCCGTNATHLRALASC